MQRRQFIEGGAALLTTAWTGSANGTATDWTTDFLRRYRRMRFAAHEDVFFWWLRGTKLGVVDARATPLYHMEIATIMRCQSQAGGAFRATSLELVFNTDLATGELLTTWHNPYSGEAVAAPAPMPLGPVTIPYSTSGPNLPTSLPGASLEHVHHSEFTAGGGDTVLLRDESTSTVKAVGASAPDFVVSDLSTYDASRRDLDNSRLRLVPTRVAFNAVSNWQRWMKMGNRPGSLLSRATGHKVARLKDMPEPVLALMARHHPEIYRDPAAALARPPARFER